MKCIVTVVKTIQIRYESEDGTGWNERYRVPSIAARKWASQKASEWKQKIFKHYGNMTAADYEAAEKREERYYIKALPIFKAMLK